MKTGGPYFWWWKCLEGERQGQRVRVIKWLGSRHAWVEFPDGHRVACSRQAFRAREWGGVIQPGPPDDPPRASGGGTLEKV